MRDFDLARRERAAKRRPVTFTLGGERFTLLPIVPLGAAFDLEDAPEPDVDQPNAIRALARMVRECLIDDDQPRWDALLRRRDDPIDPEAILEVGVEVTEAYAGRPTKPSTGSSGGRARTGRPSKPRGPKGTSPT